MTPRLSLGSWAFAFGPFAQRPWPFEEVCAYAAGVGYDGVEINGFHPHPHPDEYDSPGACAALRRRIEGFGLGVSGYAPDFRAVPPGEADESAYLALFDRCLRFCERLAIPALRVDTVSPAAADRRTDAERFARLVRTWSLAAERCRRAGVRLVWEFEPAFWLNHPAEVKRLLDAVAHPSFQVLFDTSHAYLGADGAVARWARELRPSIGHLHLVDSDGTLHEGTSAHLPFGHGRVDFAGVLRALRPVAERLPWWCVDLCACPTTETDAARAVPIVRALMRSADAAVAVAP
jgi:sugar phosphate isomerase/epimerase